MNHKPMLAMHGHTHPEMFYCVGVSESDWTLSLRPVNCTLLTPSRMTTSPFQVGAGATRAVDCVIEYWRTLVVRGHMKTAQSRHKVCQAMIGTRECIDCVGEESDVPFGSTLSKCVVATLLAWLSESSALR
ncbi:hypothetical protein PoB_007287000 [Plakobranchus ocellatus]|uniref:Uncharacterized protein n=1 Tax=Plakobranchus ocellatus TaxID=259542 RepID=A0AAV4DQN2_9GAST|nr:hypothetical protein PoB_007287000 [Plakobranchus ocellatus]